MGNTDSKECPTCKERGVTSLTVKNVHQRSTLLMPVKYFNKETNEWKTSIPNSITSNYKCQYGHTFEIKQEGRSDL